MLVTIKTNKDSFAEHHVICGKIDLYLIQTEQRAKAIEHLLAYQTVDPSPFPIEFKHLRQSLSCKIPIQAEDLPRYMGRQHLLLVEAALSEYLSCCGITASKQADQRTSETLIANNLGTRLRRLPNEVAAVHDATRRQALKTALKKLESSLSTFLEPFQKSLPPQLPTNRQTILPLLTVLNVWSESHDLLTDDLNERLYQSFSGFFHLPEWRRKLSQLTACTNDRCLVDSEYVRWLQSFLEISASQPAAQNLPALVHARPVLWMQSLLLMQMTPNKQLDFINTQVQPRLIKIRARIADSNALPPYRHHLFNHLLMQFEAELQVIPKFRFDPPTHECSHLAFSFHDEEMGTLMAKFSPIASEVSHPRTWTKRPYDYLSSHVGYRFPLFSWTKFRAIYALEVCAKKKQPLAEVTRVTLAQLDRRFADTLVMENWSSMRDFPIMDFIGILRKPKDVIAAMRHHVEIFLRPSGSTTSGTILPLLISYCLRLFSSHQNIPQVEISKVIEGSMPYLLAQYQSSQLDAVLPSLPALRLETLLKLRFAHTALYHDASLLETRYFSNYIMIHLATIRNLLPLPPTEEVQTHSDKSTLKTLGFSESFLEDSTEPLFPLDGMNVHPTPPSQPLLSPSSPTETDENPFTDKIDRLHQSLLDLERLDTTPQSLCPLGPLWSDSNSPGQISDPSKGVKPLVFNQNPAMPSSDDDRRHDKETNKRPRLESN